MIKVAVSKKLSVNMALLKDEKDEEIEELLTVCVNKIDDENSEIRKAAIQVIESASTFVAKGTYVLSIHQICIMNIR